MSEALNSDALKELARLSAALIEAEEEVERLDRAMKDAKERARILREQEIPDYMQELGLSKIVLETGETVAYKDDVRLEWDNEKKSRAFVWLEENDFGGLIKTNVIAEFGKGEIEKAKALLERLESEGFSASFKRDVNFQTMCAFLREQIEKGAPVPLDEWGATPIKKAKITAPKKPRAAA